MPIIKAQKIPQQRESSENILARFCYHFPRYSYAEAKQLPYRRIVKMLKVAEIERAKMYYNLVQIASAPHTKRGSGVSKMLKWYKDIIDEA